MMSVSLFVWDDSLLVNFEILDNQHKVLVDIINDLARGCDKGKAIKDVLFIKTLRRAVEYAQTHFTTEEKYLQQVNYPDFAAQKKEHEAFIAEVVKQLKSFEENRNDPVALVEFLKHWLYNHIAVMDKEYSPYLAGL
jgi:hemerythrin-like metal-binding protein